MQRSSKSRHYGAVPHRQTEMTRLSPISTSEGEGYWNYRIFGSADEARTRVTRLAWGLSTCTSAGGGVSVCLQGDWPW